MPTMANMTMEKNSPKERETTLIRVESFPRIMFCIA